MNTFALTCEAFSDEPFVNEGSVQLGDFRSVSVWFMSGTNSFCNSNDGWRTVSYSPRNNEGAGSSGYLCYRRGSHLTGVDAAGEELVQLDQFVWGDVELECDAVE